MAGIEVQKSKTFWTSWANAVKVCPDDGSRKRQAKASQMVYQETFGTFPVLMILPLKFRTKALEKA